MVILTLNSLAFVHKIPLVSLDFFELMHLFSYQKNIILKANKGEYLFLETSGQSPRLISIADLPSGTYFGI